MGRLAKNYVSPSGRRLQQFKALYVGRNFVNISEEAANKKKKKQRKKLKIRFNCYNKSPGSD